MYRRVHGTQLCHGAEVHRGAESLAGGASGLRPARSAAHRLADTGLRVAGALASVLCGSLCEIVSVPSACSLSPASASSLPGLLLSPSLFTGGRRCAPDDRRATACGRGGRSRIAEDLRSSEGGRRPRPPGAPPP